MRRTFALLSALLVTGLMAAVDGSSPGENYRVAGEYFETCSCEPACPCIFNSDPTHGYCKGTLVWHIRDGQRGEVLLDDLTVVVTLVTAGNMNQQAGRWLGVLYLDERATPAEQKALGAVFGDLFGALFKDLVGPKVVPIEFARRGDEHRVRIPDVLDAAIEPLSGMQGKTPRITHAPFGVGVAELSAGRSLHHRYADPDLDSWEYSGRNAFFADFTYASN